MYIYSLLEEGWRYNLGTHSQVHIKKSCNQEIWAFIFLVVGFEFLPMGRSWLKDVGNIYIKIIIEIYIENPKRKICETVCFYEIFRKLNLFLNTKLKLEKLLVIIVLKTVIAIQVLILCLGAVTITLWTLLWFSI